jgi:hypothetical protein
VITRKPGDYISHASKFTTSLFYHVASSVNRVTDLFVHQERRGTSHQTRFLSSHSPCNYALASPDNRHSHRDHHHHHHHPSSSPLILRPGLHRLRGSLYKPDQPTSTPPLRQTTPASRPVMTSKKRTTPQTEDGGPAVKRRKTSVRNAYATFLHFLSSILTFLQRQQEEEAVSVPMPSCRVAQQGLRIRHRWQRNHASLPEQDQLEN